MNLKRIDGRLYATGNNVILKNVDKEDWSYIFKDTTKQVGQIRAIAQNGTRKIYASSFRRRTAKNRQLFKCNRHQNRKRRPTNHPNPTV